MHDPWRNQFTINFFTSELLRNINNTTCDCRITVPHHHALRRLVKLEAERRSNQDLKKKKKRKKDHPCYLHDEVDFYHSFYRHFFFFFRLNRVFATFKEQFAGSKMLSLRSRKSLNLCTFFFFLHSCSRIRGV